MNTQGRLLLSALLLVGTIASTSNACVDPPPMNQTILRFVIIDPGPPMQITLIYDPWETSAASPGMTCASAFRLPPGVVASVDAVRLVQTETNTPITEFSWVADPDTTGAVETLLASGPNDDWFGFSSAISSAVAAGTLVDFQVDITLQAGMNQNHLVLAMNPALANRAFSDGANPDGTPNDTHQAFVNLLLISVPTISQWGLMVTALLMLSTATILIRGRMARTAIN